jgi:putative phosphonate metabolism protein
MHRYAIYFAPPADHPLWHAGCALLGRDPESGAPTAQPALDKVEPARVAAITEDARRYGWHGTLKPPFALAEGTDEAGLCTALARFAADRAPFPMPRLMLAPLSGFLAVIPAAPAEALVTLAADCVRAFDAFRKPPSEAELARRRRSGLTEAEERNLTRWGYPYVMDRFRFHMTLTCRLDEPEMTAVAAAMAPYLADALATPLTADAVALYGEPEAGAPFLLLDRYSFGG